LASKLQKGFVNQKMSILKIEFKKLHPNAVTPVKAHEHDACFDLWAVERNHPTDDLIIYKTGIAVNIPPGWEGQLRPRSSNRNNRLLLCNAPATIDAGFTGDMEFSYKIVGRGGISNVGDKCGQIKFSQVPKVELIEVQVFTENYSERGDKGHGSTDIKEPVISIDRQSKSYAVFDGLVGNIKRDFIPYQEEEVAIQVATQWIRQRSQAEIRIVYPKITSMKVS